MAELENSASCFQLTVEALELHLHLLGHSLLCVLHGVVGEAPSRGLQLLERRQDAALRWWHFLSLEQAVVKFEIQLVNWELGRFILLVLVEGRS